jgi:zinc-finger of transposase IS204/IS1001/IS1096/IS1165
MPSEGAASVPCRAWDVSEAGESLLAALFPHLAGLRVHRVEDAGRAVVISASCRGGQACCPRCGAASARVHGGYTRMVADGAAGGRPVLIALRVRRFRCLQEGCPAVTFAEQAEGVSARWRRRSVPLLAMLAGFGLEAAGRAGARLAGLLGIAVHPSTVLRLVAALPVPEPGAAPELLGVDLSRSGDYPDCYAAVWCRPWWRAGRWRSGCRPGRDNHKLSRKASSRSGGRYRPGLTEGDVVRARARSLMVMSACR